MARTAADNCGPTPRSAANRSAAYSLRLLTAASASGHATVHTATALNTTATAQWRCWIARTTATTTPAAMTSARRRMAAADRQSPTRPRSRIATRPATGWPANPVTVEPHRVDIATQLLSTPVAVPAMDRPSRTTHPSEISVRAGQLELPLPPRAWRGACALRRVRTPSLRGRLPGHGSSSGTQGSGPCGLPPYRAAVTTTQS